MSLLSKLFGSKQAAEDAVPESYEYKGFTVTPAPVRDGSKWRIGARVEKDVAGETRTHSLIRADLFDDVDEAKAASRGKAELMIDQLGDMIFNN